MKACVADTSWLVALLNVDDEFHAEAQEEAGSMERIHVPPAILAETLSLVKYRTGKTKATRAVVGLLSSKPTVVLGSPEHDHEATMRYWDLHANLSYHDAAAIAAAKRLGVALATFDKPQRAAMGKA